MKRKNSSSSFLRIKAWATQQWISLRYSARLSETGVASKITQSGLLKKISQKLRMPFSVTPNCHCHCYCHCLRICFTIPTRGISFDHLSNECHSLNGFRCYSPHSWADSQSRDFPCWWAVSGLMIGNHSRQPIQESKCLTLQSVGHVIVITTTTNAAYRTMMMMPVMMIMTT